MRREVKLVFLDLVNEFYTAECYRCVSKVLIENSLSNETGDTSRALVLLAIQRDRCPITYADLNKAQHRSHSLFDSAVILFARIIQIAVSPHDEICW